LLSRTHQKGQGAGGMGQYPLGSPLSRAAARALLTVKRAALFKGILVRFVPVAGKDDPGRKCICLAPEAGTVAFCRCFV
jgi:hypothetical protein